MIKPCIIGLGYVGLPLLISLSKKFKIIGYDTDKNRISKLNNNVDIYKEFDKKKLNNKNISYTCNLYKISNANFYIIAVPTPVYKNKTPNLSHLIKVSKSLSKVLKKGDH